MEILDSLTSKLTHELVEIRTRAVQTLTFKMNSGIISPMMVLNHSPILRAILHSIVPECYNTPLTFLKTWSQDEVEFRKKWVHLGAIPYLQMVKEQLQDEDQAAFTEVLDLLVALMPSGPTSSVVLQKEVPPPSPVKKEEDDEDLPWDIANEERISISPQTKSDNRLSAQGWCFPPVALTKSDETLLFEFEVKFRMRKNPEDLFQMCTEFQEVLLCNFPPEVFLQRRGVIQHFIALLQRPSDLLGEGSSRFRDVIDLEFGECYYGLKSKRDQPQPESRLMLAVLDSIDSFVGRLVETFQTHCNESLHTKARNVPKESQMAYPSSGPSKRVNPIETEAEDDISDGKMMTTSYSFCGVAYTVLVSILPLLCTDAYPVLQLVNLASKLTAMIFEPEGDSRAKEALDHQRLSAVFAALEHVVQSQFTNLNIRAKSELGYDQAPNVAYWKIVKLLNNLATRFEPRVYQNDVEIGPNTQHLLTELCFDEYVFHVDPTIRNSLLPLLTLFEPDIEQRLSNIRTIADKVQSTNLLVDKMQRFLQFGNRDLVGTQSEINDWEELLSLTQDASTYLKYRPQNSITVLCAMVSFICCSMNVRSKKVYTESFQILSYLFTSSPTSEVHQSLVSVFYQLLQQEKCAYIDLVILSDDELQAFLFTVITDTPVLQHVLKYLVAREESSAATKPLLWKILRKLLSVLDEQNEQDTIVSKSTLVKRLMPYLQFIAYKDQEATASEDEKKVQEILKRMLHAEDSSLDQKSRFFCMSRCLFSTSDLIRETAAQGLYRIVDVLDCHPFIDPFRELQSNIKFQNFSSDGHPTSSQVTENELESFFRLSEIVSESTGEDLDGTIQKSAMIQLMDLYRMNSNFTAIAMRKELQEPLLKSLVEVTERSKSPNVLTALKFLAVLSQADLSFRNYIRDLPYSFFRQTLGPLLFHDNSDIRCQCFCILLPLTLCNEVWDVPSAKACAIPALIQTSENKNPFGLHENFWKAELGLDLLAFDFQDLTGSSTRADSTAVEDVIQLTFQNNGHAPPILETMSQILSEESTVLMMYQLMSNATSHRHFLNRIYYLTMLCDDKKVAEVSATVDWYSYLERFLSESPTSDRDECVLRALLQLFSKLAPYLNLGQTAQLLAWLRNTILPLLASSDALRSTRKEILNLLLNLPLSLTQSLMVDSNLVEVLVCCYLPANAQDVWMQDQALQLLGLCTLEFQQYVLPSGDEKALASWNRQARQLIRHIVPILQIHRLPDSFQESNVLVSALRVLCLLPANLLITIVDLKTTSERDEGSSLHKQMAWCTRLTYARDARTRQFSYRVFYKVVAGILAEATPKSEMLRGVSSLAIKAIRDPHECSSVKQEAFHLVNCFIERYLSVIEVGKSPLVVESLEFLSEKPSDEQVIVILGEGGILDTIMYMMTDECKLPSPHLLEGIYKVLRTILSTKLARFVPEILSREVKNVIAKSCCTVYHQARLIDMTFSTCKIKFSSPFNNKSFFGAAMESLWCHEYETMVDIVAQRGLWVLQQTIQCDPSSSDFYLHHTPLIYSLLKSLSQLSPPRKSDSNKTVVKDSARAALLEATLVALSNFIAAPQVNDAARRSVPLIPPSDEHSRMPSLLVKLTASTTLLQIRVASCQLILSTATYSYWRKCFTHGGEDMTNLSLNLLDLLQELHSKTFSTSMSEKLLILQMARTCGVAISSLFENCEDADVGSQLHYSVILEFALESAQDLHDSLKMSRCNSKCDTPAKRGIYLTLLQIYLQIISSCMLYSTQAQHSAYAYKFMSIVSALWPLSSAKKSQKEISCVATTTNSLPSVPLLTTFLEMLKNFVRENETTKRAMIEPLPGSLRVSNHDCLVSGVMNYLKTNVAIIPPKQKKRAPSTTLNPHIALGFRFLQSLVLNRECRAFILKSGFVEDCMSQLLHVLSVCKREESNVSALLAFLTNVSRFSPTSILHYANAKQVVLDLLQLTEFPELTKGSAKLFQELSFHKISKSCFIAWSPGFINAVMSILENESSLTDSTAYYLATVLLCIVYDHQRGSAALVNLGIPDRLLSIKKALMTNDDASDKAVLTESISYRLEVAMQIMNGSKKHSNSDSAAAMLRSSYYNNTQRRIIS